MRYIVNMFKKIHFWLYFIVFNFVLSGCYLQRSIKGRGNPEGYVDLSFMKLLYWGMSISFIIAVVAALTAIWSDDSDDQNKSAATVVLFMLIAFLVFIIA